MPATHIIHREACAAGDKRFMKLAAVVRSKKLNAVVVPTPEDYGTRMPSSANTGYGQQQIQGPVVPLNQTGSHHMQISSEIVRRAAILNRIRLKVQDERNGHAATAAVVPCEVGAGDGSSPAGTHRSLKTNTTEGSEEAPAAGSSSYRETTATDAEKDLKPSQPPASHSNSSAADVLQLGRLSARIQPIRSPELRACRGQQINKAMDEDQLDDDSLSFPNNSVLFADEEAADCCLGEDVYADFSIIFGGVGDDSVGVESAADGTGIIGVPVAGTENFEDYMDDLDGIPRAVR